MHDDDEQQRGRGGRWLLGLIALVGLVLASAVVVVFAAPSASAAPGEAPSVPAGGVLRVTTGAPANSTVFGNLTIT